MNLAKDSRTVGAVHYQEFLPLVKSEIKKLKEKEMVCCSVTKKERNCVPGCGYFMASWRQWGCGPPLVLPEPARVLQIL